MKQKLALSCALIHAPDVLILDEPTTGVDAVSRKEFWEMLKDLKEKGISIIVATPYMDEASMCDRVALIQDGNIMKINSPDSIVKQFEKDIYEIKSDNTYRLLNDLRNYSQTHSAHAFGQGIHYTDVLKKIDIDGILLYLSERKHTNINIEKIEANIEDCFMELMLRN